MEAAFLTLFANPMAFTSLVLALLVVCVCTVWHYGSREVVAYLPLPPGHERVWGHEKTVFMNEPGKAFRAWTNEVGLAYRIKAAFGAQDILVLNDPVGIAHILQKKIYNYHHSRVVRPRVARLLGKGLGWVEGEAEHKRMRHLISPSLSPENLRAMSSDLRLAASQVVDDLLLHTQTSKDAPIVNILDWTAKATLNVIGRVAFLHDFQAGNSEDARKILDARRQGVSPVLRYTGFITLMLLRRFPFLNDLPIPSIQAQGLAKTVIQSGVAREMIERNKDLVNNAAAKPDKDLLSRLLRAHSAGQISEQELLEQISTFVVSGHETTTQTLGFTIWELSRHPETQRRLREELESLLGEPTYDDFQSRLPYLDAVLKETLRLYPGLPYMERVSVEDDIIPLSESVRLSNGGTTRELPISANQVVLIPIIAIHRMDSVWHDPDSFRPERWLSDMPPKDKLCAGWANTLAFSDGPRSCIGMRLAIFQYKVILTYMLQRFEFGDTRDDITLKIASSLQAWVSDKKELGPCLRVCLHLV